MRIRLAALAVACTMVPTVASATILGQHLGAADPTSEGFALVNTFASVATGPVINDLGSGLDAWAVDDNGTALGDAGWYAHALSPGQVAGAAAFGWRLSTRLRIVDAPDPAPSAPGIGFDASPFVAYRDGTTSFQIHFGAEADGDPLVHVATAFAPSPAGTVFTLQGGGSGYHLYELVYSPLGGLDLFIDGTERLSDLPAAPLVVVSPAFMFGAGSSCCTGQGNFNLVRFESFAPDEVPEPGSLYGLAVGLIALGALRRRAA